MSKNSRLILRQTELFQKGRLKISNQTINPYIELSEADLQTLSSRGIFPALAGFYIDKDTAINPTIVNAESLVEGVNEARRAADSVSYEDIIPGDADSSSLLERVPVHLNVNENLQNISRMSSEYSAKLARLQSLRSGLFDPDYAVEMYNLGRGQNITGNLSGGRFTSMPGGFTISGYIKVEHASSAIAMNVVVRGVPVPMRKTETSANQDGTRNYVFTYPQYLLDTRKSVNSIQHIEVSGQGSSQMLEFYKGSNSDPRYGFLIRAESLGNNDYTNLQIFNKEGRNEY